MLARKDAATSPIRPEIQNEAANATASTENFDPKSPMASTSNAVSDVVLSNDMATSLMQNMDLSEKSQSTPSNNGNLIAYQTDASVDIVQHIDIRVVSIGDSSLSIVSSFETDNKVN